MVVPAESLGKRLLGRRQEQMLPVARRATWTMEICARCAASRSTRQISHLNPVTVGTRCAPTTRLDSLSQLQLPSPPDACLTPLPVFGRSGLFALLFCAAAGMPLVLRPHPEPRRWPLPSVPLTIRRREEGRGRQRWVILGRIR